MRRDVMRVGLGRLAFEIALGVVLVAPMSDRDRTVSIGLAVAASLAVHLFFRRGIRRAFFASHLALGALAIAVHVEPSVARVVLASALGAVIELGHVDLVERRRLHEHLGTFRVPSSLVVRRLGTVVIVAAAARAAMSIGVTSVRPLALATIFVVVGAIAMLVAGIGAGPGRPVARPRDALIFLALGIALAIPVGLSAS